MEEESDQSNNNKNKPLELNQQISQLFPSFPLGLIDYILSIGKAKTVDEFLQTLDQLSRQQEEAEKEPQQDQASKKPSIVKPANEYGSKCSYCNKSKTGRISFGMDASRLTVEDYQALIDRGWRRSGTWLYKPSNEHPDACCPQYTIRLAVKDFVPSKSHVKVVKNLEKYLNSDIKPKEKDHATKPQQSSSSSSSKTATPTSHQKPESQKPEVQKTEKMEDFLTVAPIQQEIYSQLETALEMLLTSPDLSKHSINPSNIPLLITPNIEKFHSTRGEYSSNIALVIHGNLSKIIRPHKKRVISNNNHNLPQDNTNNDKDNKDNNHSNKSEKESSSEPISLQEDVTKIPTAKEIAEILVSFLPHESYNVTIGDTGFINFFTTPSSPPVDKPSAKQNKDKTPVREENTQDKRSYVSHEKEKQKEKQTSHSQTSSTTTTTTHSNSKPPTSSTHLKEFFEKLISSGEIAGNSHKISISTKSSVFDEEEYNLYRRYQISVHLDKPDKLSPEGYTRFLVDGPFVKVPQREGIPSSGFGNFHQQYRIDGKLVAVGVVDILPYCLSSVYLFYDPDFSFLQLGIFTALFEIFWTNIHSLNAPNFQYYYLGFYIHTCQKMRYKGQFSPSELLCNETFRWVPIDVCVNLLEHTKYTPFVSDPTLLQAAQQNKENIEKAGPDLFQQIPIYNGKRLINYDDLTSKGRSIITPIFKMYIKKVGLDLARSMYYQI